MTRDEPNRPFKPSIIDNTRRAVVNTNRLGKQLAILASASAQSAAETARLFGNRDAMWWWWLTEGRVNGFIWPGISRRRSCALRRSPPDSLPFLNNDSFLLLIIIVCSTGDFPVSSTYPPLRWWRRRADCVGVRLKNGGGAEREIRSRVTVWRLVSARERRVLMQLIGGLGVGHAAAATEELGVTLSTDRVFELLSQEDCR